MFKKLIKLTLILALSLFLLSDVALARIIFNEGGGGGSVLPYQTDNPGAYGTQTHSYQYQVDEHHYYVETGGTWSLLAPGSSSSGSSGGASYNSTGSTTIYHYYPPVPPHPPIPVPVLPPPPQPSYDYSDAPTSIYGIAKHKVSSDPYQWFGNSVDTEFGTGHDPEDATDGGISILTPLIPGEGATGRFTAHSRRSAKEQIRIWIDWHHDGFQNNIDQIYHNSIYLKPVKTVTFNFMVPTSALLGPTWLRARICCQNHVDPTGYRSQGEVEDHQVDVVPEPASMILLGSLATGLFGVFGIRRKFSRR